MNRRISGSTGIVGVAGNPVSHSLSPVFQNYLISQEKLDLVYIPFQVPPREFEHFFRSVCGLENLRGFNVTIPYKEKASGLVDVLSREGEDLEAVNTIVMESGKSYGYNTDIYGIITTLGRKLGIRTMRGRGAVVYGAGGAARAAICAVAGLGAESVTVINRGHERAAALKEWAGSRFGVKVNLSGPQESATGVAWRNTGLVINATPVGLKGESLDLDVNRLEKKCAVFDMAYGAAVTPLVRGALRRGLRAADGLYMLVCQGVKSFTLWTDRRPDEERVFRYLMRKVRYGKNTGN